MGLGSLGFEEKPMSAKHLVKLGDFIEVHHGYAFESAGFQESGEFALLTPGNFHEEGGFRRQHAQQKRYAGDVDPKWILKPGEILVAMTEQAAGLLGAAIRIPEDDQWLHNQRMGLVEIKNSDRLCAGYLYHWFNSASARKLISVAASGTKVRHSSPSQIYSLQLPLPDKRTQLWVAEVLDEWYGAIDKASSLLLVLERRKQGLMQQLLTGRRRLKGFKGKWKPVRLDAVLERVTRKNTTGCMTPLTVSAQRGLVEQSSYFAKQIAATDNDHYLLLKRGEFAYNRSASAGYPLGAIKRLDSFDEGIVSTLCLCFRIADDEKTDSDFLVGLIEAGLLNRALRAIAHEGARSHGLLNVTATDFFNMRVDLPSIDEQRAMAEVLRDMDEEIGLRRSQLDELKAQKRALMQKLLSGESRLPEVPTQRKPIRKKGLQPPNTVRKQLSKK